MIPFKLLRGPKIKYNNHYYDSLVLDILRDSVRNHIDLYGIERFFRENYIYKKLKITNIVRVNISRENPERLVAVYSNITWGDDVYLTNHRTYFMPEFYNQIMHGTN